MRQPDPEKKQEILIYCILWGVVFALVPVTLLLRKGSSGTGFRLWEMLSVWREILPFFILFILHDLFVAPLWAEKGKPGVYAVALLALLACFGLFLRYDDRPVSRAFPPEAPRESTVSSRVSPSPVPAVVPRPAAKAEAGARPIPPSQPPFPPPPHMPPPGSKGRVPLSPE